MACSCLIWIATLVAAPPDEPVAARFAALAHEHDAKLAAFSKAMRGTDDPTERAVPVPTRI